MVFYTLTVTIKELLPQSLPAEVVVSLTLDEEQERTRCIQLQQTTTISIPATQKRNKKTGDSRDFFGRRKRNGGDLYEYHHNYCGVEAGLKLAETVR
jgi:hypothetical protein